MAALSVIGVTRRCFTCAFLRAPRRGIWSRFRKEEKPVVTEVVEVEEVKKEPSLVCPPLRSRTYIPPEDLQSRLESHVKEIFGSSVSGTWQDVSLEDVHLKFNFLACLANDLGHAVPNSRLHQMCRVSDVLDFYSVPVQDRSKFDEFISSNLPPNLKITWGY
ncbi:39S ribosomal protein L50, mitochondrial [Talpa occidentalis]|uniref:39S ribosomal protein L50, mitochondrial n=1 Tax=Talpa occidentalis TaxID=50954 RepID=UPI00188FD317|nr:39S ribosomal protein L50, mitochondrial [Talpa occidentalis]